MRPSAKQLIEGIDWSLQQRVSPVTEDKWAASTLRSVHCLLQHLAVRVEVEGTLLHDDNADLRATLSVVCETLVGTAEEPLADGLADALGRRWRDDGAYPTIESLSAENDSLRTLVDDLLRALHPSSRSGGPAATALEALDGYLARRLQREQPLFVPAFLSSTF